ncbi:MAG: ribose 5-phosphate isomerase B [Planctomycetaceae bacterium]|jgi:ribose 5-phosphate isomerase B|nr:ribose 5-phosphate isomerase B [Planctomycetaceae bacterium]
MKMVKGGNPMRIKIILGCDHRGKDTFDLISKYLRSSENYTLVCANDELMAGSVDYPDIAGIVAREVSAQRADYGILICGTGVGMCVVANKYRGVRAAPCHNEVAAELSRAHNDANILCLSGDMLGERSTLAIVDKWLNTVFVGGRHQIRLDKIKNIESRNARQQKIESQLKLDLIPKNNRLVAMF